MKLYQVLFDGETDFVEAPGFVEAIVVWRSKLLRENEPGDFDHDVQPEAVMLMHDGPVLRAETQVTQVEERKPHRPDFAEDPATLRIAEHFKAEDGREFFVEMSIKGRKDLPAVPKEKLLHVVEDLSRQAATILYDVR
jgi:hypothetical protein